MVVVGQLVLRILDGAVLGAELLAELGRACGTYLDALAACDAVFLVDMGNVGAAGHIGSVEKLRGAQSVAYAGCAVADGEYLVLAVDIGYLMDIALVLGALEYLHDLLIGRLVTVLAGLDGVLCAVADGDAPEVGEVAAAFTAHGLRAAAGANADCVCIVFLQPVGEMLNTDGLGVGRYRLFDGDDVHTDTGAAERNHGSDLFKGETRHALKEVAHLGVLVDKVLAHVKKFCSAGNEEREKILLYVLGILPVIFEKTDAAHFLQLGLKRFRVAAACRFGDLLKSHGDALFHAQCYIDHLIVENVYKTPVFGTVFSELFKAELIGDAVGHFFTELKELFFVSYHILLLSLERETCCSITVKNITQPDKSHAKLTRFGGNFVELYITAIVYKNAAYIRRVISNILLASALTAGVIDGVFTGQEYL